MNEDEKIRVAYHEAGHALVAAALPNTDPVHKVSIIPRGLAALGYTMQRPESDRYLMTKTELESHMKVLLAGTLTEEMIFQDISTGAQNDLERCTEIARSMVMDYGMSRLGRINFRRSSRSPFLAGGGGDGYQMMHSEEMAKLIDKEVARIIEDELIHTREILEQRERFSKRSRSDCWKSNRSNSELMRLIEENTRVLGWFPEPLPKNRGPKSGAIRPPRTKEPRPSPSSLLIFKNPPAASALSKLRIGVQRASGKGVRNQKCEAPFGPFGFWFLTPFPGQPQNQALTKH